MLESLSLDLGPVLLITGTPCGVSGQGVIVRRSIPYNRRGKLARIFSWLAFGLDAFIQLLFRVPASVVLVVSNPPFLPHLAFLASRIRRFPYVVVIWDVYPEHLVAAGLTSETGHFVRVWRALNRMTCRDASSVLTLSEGMAATIRSRWLSGESGLCVKVVPLWVRGGRLNAGLERGNQPPETGLVPTLTVLYAGNIGASHDLDPLLEAAKCLAADPRFKFVIVGDGLGRARLEARVREYALANVKLLEHQSEESFHKIVASADISVVSQAPGSEDLSFPSKILTALEAGKCILAITKRDAALATLIERGACGYVFEAGDGIEMARKLVALYESPELLWAMKCAARDLGERKFAFEAVRHQLIAEIRLANGFST